MHLGANVLLPEGFDSHPNARYPLVIFHGHFPADFGGFPRDTAGSNLKPDYSERFKVSGYNKIVRSTPPQVLPGMDRSELSHDHYRDTTCESLL